MFRIHNINEQNKKRPDFHQNQAVINAISFVFYLFEDKRRDKPAIKQVCLFLVRMTGLEPARPGAMEPKSIVYANFTTSAYNNDIIFQ